ncbi:MAG: gliding motility lipoprotein GldD [Nonlabens sp.]
MYPTLKLTFLLVLIVILSSACKDDVVIPKPSAQLALQYNRGAYQKVTRDQCPYVFEANEYARVLAKSDCSMKIEYPQMDATVYINYKPVQGNLRDLLIDGQKLSYDHNRKADVIAEFPFQNPEKRAYGMMYEVEGDAASNAQFYVTDSTKHFLTGALYFYAQPNFDSIYPAVDYVKKDMVRLLESLEWKN